MPAAASPAASASCSCCRWAVSHSCCRRAAPCSSPRSPRWRCWATPSGSNSPGTPTSPPMPPPDLLGVVLFAIAAAASFVASRMRESEDSGPPEGRRSRKPRRALAVHRAAPAREPAGGRCRRQNPPDQRIGRRNSRRRSRRPGRLGRRGIAAPAVLADHLAAAASAATMRPSSFVAADGARVIQPHFAPLGDSRPGPL